MSIENILKKIDPPWKHLPEEYANLTVICEHCRGQFPIPWSEPFNEPFTPVIPNHGPGHWSMIGKLLECLYCKKQTLLNIPFVSKKAALSFFGDEAYRNVDEKLVYTYSLVGANNCHVNELQEQFFSIKTKFLPGLRYDNWAFHATNLLSGQKRAENPMFQNKTKEDVLGLFDSIFKFINQNSDKLFVYNIAYCSKASVSGKAARIGIENARYNAYISLVLKLIYEFTSKGASVEFFFDAEKKVKEGASSVVQEWARNAFHGHQHFLPYAFISHGIPVPEPKFLVPASTPFLEIADFVSFIIGRYYYCKWKNIAPDFPPEKLGVCTFIGFEEDGNIFFDRRNGYPWEMFLGSKLK